MLGHQVQVAVVEPDRVRAGEALAQETERRDVLHHGPSVQVPRRDRLWSGLEQMRVDREAMRRRRLGDEREHLVGAAEGRPRAEAYRDPTLRPVPAASDREAALHQLASGRRRRRAQHLGAQRVGQALDVPGHRVAKGTIGHHGTDDGTDAAVDDGADRGHSRIDALRTVFQHRRRAVLQHAQHADHGRHPGIPLRPAVGAGAQERPSDVERKAVDQPRNQRAVEVRVRVDQAGDDERARRVDDLVARRAFHPPGIGAPCDARDAVAFDDDRRALGADIVAGRRDDHPIADDQRHRQLRAATGPASIVPPTPRPPCRMRFSRWRSWRTRMSSSGSPSTTSRSASAPGASTPTTPSR